MSVDGHLHGVSRSFWGGRTLVSVAVLLILLVSAIAGVFAAPAQATESVEYCDSELVFLSMLNEYREAHGAPALLVSDTLSLGAQRHSSDMAKYEFFDHYTVKSDWFPAGYSPFQRMDAVGYNYYTSKGENIAAGQMTALSALTAFQGSAGHNALMLDPVYKVVGIGLVYDPYSPYQWYWTVDFGGYVDPSAHPVGQYHQQTDPKITYLGHWASSSDRTFYWSYEPGAAAVISFEGTAIDIIAKKAPRYGIAEMSLDGGSPVQVDFYAPSDVCSQLVKSFTGLADKKHTLTIRYAGKKNSASTGYIIDLDSLRVDGDLLQAPRAVQQSDPKITYIGHWACSSDGTFYYSYEPGAAAVISFEGTSLDLYGKKAPRYGLAEVTMDDQKPVLVDFYASTDKAGQLIRQWTSLSEGSHTLTIRYTGKKNSASTSTIINIDSLFIDGELTQAPKLIQQTDPKITYVGNWLWGGSGTFYWAYEPGATAFVSFEGTALDLYGKKAPRYGIAEVSVDGKAPVEWDFYAPVDKANQLIGSIEGLSAGSHTVTIRLAAKKSSASSGYIINVDSLCVNGTLIQAPALVQQTDPKITYLGNWASGGSGTFYWAYELGATAVVSFEGTALDLYGKKAPRYGIAEVSVDGKAPVEWDFYAPVDKDNQLIGSIDGLSEGSHTVTMKLAAKKSSASTSYIINIDSLCIDGTLVEAPQPMQETCTQIDYDGQWLWGGGGTFFWAYGEGAAAVISFEGTSIDLYGKKAPRYGIAEVSVDGKAPVEWDFYAPVDMANQLIGSIEGLSEGEHTLIISWTGDKCSASTGCIVNIDYAYADSHTE